MRTAWRPIKEIDSKAHRRAPAHRTVVSFPLKHETTINAMLIDQIYKRISSI